MTYYWTYIYIYIYIYTLYNLRTQIFDGDTCTMVCTAESALVAMATAAAGTPLY